MSALEFDLARLLHPIDAEGFFSQHWERQPLLIRRNDPSFYAPLVSLGDIEAFISRGDARYPAIRIAKGGSFYGPEAYTHDFKYGDEVFRGVPDLEQILTEYSQGATLSLPAWHLAWPPLGRLCARLEGELDHAVTTNVYLTPPRAAGFTPHYDTHEVLVLQIVGGKHWRVYPPPTVLPHRSQIFDFKSYMPPAKPMLECDLSAGDLLYLPRGFVHTTATAEQASAHLTIGVTLYTCVELLAELAQSSVDLPDVRASLPPGFAHRAEAEAALARRLRQLLRELAESVEFEAVARRFVQRVLRARPRPPIEFHTDTSAIGPDTLLRVASGISYSTMQEQGGLVLLLNGRRIRLQSGVEPIVSAMCSSTAFTPQSLPASVSLDARLTLSRYLFGVGFLRAA